MRGHTLSALFAVVLACGGEHAEPVTPARADPASQPAADAPAPETESAPETEPASDAVEGGECTADADCGGCMFAAPIARTADCACTHCASGAMPVATCAAIMASYHATCDAWLAHHDCPPVSCAPASPVACSGGACVSEDDAL